MARPPRSPDSGPRRRRPPLLPWVLRAAWAVLPLACGSALAASLHPRAHVVRTVASTGLWAVWALVVVATLVPHPISLTVLRVVAPLPLVAAGLAASSGHTSLSALVAAVAVITLAFSPEIGQSFTNGPAYANERRFLLRPPGPLLLGPLELAWALSVGPPLAGLLLIAAGRWVIGGLLLGLGTPLAVVLLRSLHGLSRRWAVFVPAGLVVHDPLSLTDPVLFQKRQIESLHPALADSDSLDLTQKATGLTLELVLREKVPMILITPASRGGEAGSSARLLFTPTRPGAVLAEAARRNISRIAAP